MHQRGIGPEQNENMCCTKIQQMQANLSISLGKPIQSNARKFLGIDLSVRFDHFEGDMLNLASISLLPV
jgi:hypothetical protein